MSVNDASRIVIDTSMVMLQIVASLTEYSRGIICDSNMSVVQATDAVLTIDSNIFQDHSNLIPVLKNFPLKCLLKNI